MEKDKEETNQVVGHEPSPSGCNNSDDELTDPVIPDNSSIMKRAAAKKLIEKYYNQLTNGCGNPTCQNVNCASSGKVPTMTPDIAAAQALQLFMEKARLCEVNPSKISRFDQPGCSCSVDSKQLHGETTKSEVRRMEVTNKAEDKLGSESCDLPQSTKSKTADVSWCHKYLSEGLLHGIIEKCKKDQTFSPLVRTIGQIYSNAECLNRSFLRSPEKNQLKEQIRDSEGEPDKDEDSMDTSDASQQTVKSSHLKLDEVTLDFQSLRRAYQLLFSLDGLPFTSSLINALSMLCETAELELKYHNCYDRDPNYLNMFFIVSELPYLQNVEFQDIVFPVFCKAMALLPLTAQAKYARVCAKQCSSHQIKGLIDALHQLITIKIYTQRFDREYCINDEPSITSATKVLKILFYACIVGGEMEKVTFFVEDAATESSDMHIDIFQDEFSQLKSVEDSNKPIEDPLALELGVKVIDCRKPLVDFCEFYHEPLSDQLEMDRDFAYYKSEHEAKNPSGNSDGKFSFMNYPFILTPATKALGLYYDNRTRMYSERRISMFQSFVRGAPPSPFLKLKVRRDHIIDDALVELEMIAMENPTDLKKQLVVEFEGEQGIDEGGVSKEFFQLVVEEVFNPDFAMFTLDPDIQLYWFNPTSFESDAQFTLIGIVLGLAIYNNVILDVQFPMVVYRKLLGKAGTFLDLKELRPMHFYIRVVGPQIAFADPIESNGITRDSMFLQSLYNGLKELLEYEGDDIQDVFMQSFRVGYQDVFGSYATHDLKENGADILVNQSNKEEFVNLYANYILNKSVEKQFRAFKRGFQMVTDESPIKLLFRPEEVELLVCGSKNFNFSALEEATEYDGGYTADSAIIKYFWQIVHEFSEEQKRKLLQFCTGSDRVPVGGLSKLKLIIARHGPDSDRLPTAHTCFNVLLLPEYSNKDKLSSALLKAIMYSKGFGML